MIVRGRDSDVDNKITFDELPQLTVEVGKGMCAQSVAGCKETLTTILRPLSVENCVGVHPFWRSEWYLSWLPDHGDLTLTCAWPKLGIAETQVTVRGATVREERVGRTVLGS